MSMDDQFRELLLFRRSLSQFNERLAESFRDLERHYESVSPFWQDSWRQDYESTWQALEEGLRDYLVREGPIYTAFLNDKIRALGSYLGV